MQGCAKQARRWADDFVHWYNHERRHSGIRYVTPAQRHSGADRQILAGRHDVYEQARQAHPQRWAGKTRNWSFIKVVKLNPDKDQAHPA